MKHRCPACGADGQYNSMNKFVSDHWLRASTLQQENDNLRAQLTAAEQRATEAEKDAERYALTLDLICTETDLPMLEVFERVPFAGEFPTKDEFNAAIDAAIAASKEAGK
jgi:hypothetical protein